MDAEKTTPLRLQISHPLDVEQRRNNALRLAIRFARVQLVANIVYFSWRIIAIARSVKVASGWEIAAYVAFLVIEWTFTVTGLLNALILSALGKKWVPQKARRATGPDVPLIDVFMPCFGESEDIITDTILGIIYQDYPQERYRMVVLDDGNSPSVRKLVSRLAAEHPSAQLHYATRGAEIKMHSKAANINFGLDFVKSLEGGAAPYFGTLDIDMLMGPQWLQACVPLLLEDDKVALVGAPHKHYNLPSGFALPNRFMLETEVTQRLFDSSGKAVCMATGYVAKRDIFDKFGGLPTMVKQEDSFSVSIMLQAHGYKLRLLEEEYQHGICAVTYSDCAKLHVKWMAGITHAYTLLWHPVLRDQPLASRLSGCFPIFHLTLLRLFLMLSLPAILFLARAQVIPDQGEQTLIITTILASIAYSASYILSWITVKAANGTIPLDDGNRLWILPYQLRGLVWLAHNAIFGETRLPKFLSTGADVAASKRQARSGVLGKLATMLVYDGAWIHLTYFFCLSFMLWKPLSEVSSMETAKLRTVAASIAYPPFTKILCECLCQALTPVQYVLSPDPDMVSREALLQRDEKTGVARPKQEAIAHPKPALFGTFGITAFTWLYFGLASAWVATH